jgi:multidrug resistance efflux pump
MAEPIETPRPEQATTLEDSLVGGAGLLLSRSVIYLALLLLATAVVFAAVARVDVVVVSRGQLVVKGEPIGLTPPEPGLVVEVPVVAGSHVEKGDVLLRILAQHHAAEGERLEAELRALDGEAARHEESARSAEAASRSVGEEILMVKQTIEILSAQLETLRELERDGAAAQLQVDEKERELIDARSRILRLEAEVRRGRDDAGERRRVAVETRERAAGLAAKMRDMRESEGQLTLVAPVSGTVVRVAVKHPGSVLGVGEPAVLLEPDGQPLQALLRVPNASMRGVRPGEPVRLRLDAYPHADHGFVEGRVQRVDPEPEADGSFRAWASVESAKRPEQLPLSSLRPGLLLDGEIVVDRRSLVDLALRPVRALDKPMTVTQ